MMKRFFFVLTFALLGVSAFADTAPGMVIKKTDLSSVEIAISLIQSIKFSDGNMVVNKTSGEALTLSVDEVSIITFSDVQTAINAIVGTDGNASLTVTDISGKQLYSGSKSGFSQSLHGIFIINGKKVAIQ